MNNKKEKLDANEFRIQLKSKLSSSNKTSVIYAIESSPKFSNYYHLQDNDWYQLREKDNQDVTNPPNIEILLKEDYLLIMRSADNKPWWIDLEKLKAVLESEIQEITVTVENYWEQSIKINNTQQLISARAKATFCHTKLIFKGSGKTSDISKRQDEIEKNFLLHITFVMRNRNKEKIISIDFD